jgi:Tfp pilus assembly protein PilF
MDCHLKQIALALLVASAPGLYAQASRSREAALLNNLGTALMNQQQLQLAADKFAAAYAADPSLPVAKINEGLADIYLQKLPEAHAALQVAAEKAPSDPRTWYALGLLYRSESDPHQSFEAFEKVIALDQKDADAHYMAGSLDLELKEFAAAALEFRKTLALNPLHASAEFGLARCLQRQAKTEESKAAFMRFQTITGTKVGSPLSHNYGEEGRYGRVEDVSLSLPVPPMIDVHFAQTWHSPAGINAAGTPCLMELQGKMTLVVPTTGDQALRLLRNTSKSSGEPDFEWIARDQTSIELPGTGVACAVGDYDSDGLPDLAVIVVNPEHQVRVHLLRNLGGGRFEDTTKAAGIVTADAPTSLTFVDYDHDGDLDLLVTGKGDASQNELWRNNGNKTFTNWTKQAGLEGALPTSSATLSDLNNDRAVDLITAGSGAPTIYTNRREGPFSASVLYATSEKLSSTNSVSTLDFNKDGWMDLLVTQEGAPGVSLWRNIEGNSFERVALPTKDITRATAAIPVDFDNDGWIDIATVVETAKGYALRVFRNLGTEGFRDISSELKLEQIELGGPASLLAADFTHSGAPDLLVTRADGSLVLLSNLGGNTNHSLPLSFAGLADNKSAIGAKVEVYANALWQKWEITKQPEILVGLGSATHADLIRILWPTGVPQDEIVDSSAPLKLPIQEIDRRGSSCPTLFAWDGGRYSFVSDVIGAAVVGHWVSPTATNIPDADEWIKIFGSKIREHNGQYSLRFGEPMEEVNFLDQVRLVAIDHPAGASVYPNEGFLSEPPFRESKTISAEFAHPLAAAYDSKGMDVLALLSKPLRHDADLAPPEYVRDFTNLPFAGFANQHSLTLDIGPWSPAQPIRLLLHGFIEYFSASSMFSAWQAGITPIPPYIEARSQGGSWQRIVDDMGFPAGLPRTVVVDLTGKLPPGTRTIRITTNLQIYWDQMLVDNESRPPATRQIELPLAKADLEFRGYPEQQDGHTPGDLNYDYQQISKTGPFLAHRGAYTRYGDVTPLLGAVDDEFVIFGTGEDLDLEFSAGTLPPLPTGWSRDFFFYANGFVKDMDFYEASPFQVGQLPFHGMSAYPYPPTEHYPDDPAHIAYQLNYNTRWEPGTPNHALRFDYRPRLSFPDSQ